MRWQSHFDKVCDFVAQLPDEVPTVVGGYQATLEVNTSSSGPNIDAVAARGKRSSSRS
jgi:hypothetical protein